MSRLRPPNDSYGLTSRDDNRLLDLGNFTSFWRSIKSDVRPLHCIFSCQVDEFLNESSVDDLTGDIANLSLSASIHRPASKTAKSDSLLSDLSKLSCANPSDGRKTEGSVDFASKTGQ